MNDIIRIGNTPIFEKLALEFAIRGKRYESLVREGGVDLQKYPATASQRRPRGFMAPGAYIDEWRADNAPLQPPERARISENVDPDELLERDVGFEEFVQEIVKRFGRKYPDVEGRIDLMTKEELDGTVTVIVAEASRESKPVLPVRPVLNGTEKVVRHLQELQSEMGESESLISYFVNDQIETFKQHHPSGIITGMTPKMNPDGSVAMLIEGVEPYNSDDLAYVKEHFPRMSARMVDPLADFIDPETIAPEYRENPSHANTESNGDSDEE